MGAAIKRTQFKDVPDWAGADSGDCGLTLKWATLGTPDGRLRFCPRHPFAPLPPRPDCGTARARHSQSLGCRLREMNLGASEATPPNPLSSPTRAIIPARRSRQLPQSYGGC